MTFKRFLHNGVGSTVTVFALTLPLLLGAGAFAVDVSYYKAVQGKLQSAADAAAIGVIRLVENSSGNAADLAEKIEDAADLAVEIAEKNLPPSYGNVVSPSDVVFGTYDPASRAFVPVLPGGTGVNAVAVTAVREPARGNAVPRYLSMIWGSDGVAIRARAIAALTGSITYEPPEKTDLDNEAGDYNQIWVYCYRYEGGGDPPSRRSQMTLIADNGGTVYEGTYEWPRCGPGESLSFRMRNVRHAKGNPKQWNNQPPVNAEFSFYTDTEIVSGVENFNMRREIVWVSSQSSWQTYVAGVSPEAYFNILETVRCDTKEQCDPAAADNIIPKGKNRTPQVSDLACEPGKFMYFGWEDRPPGQKGPNGGWMDPAWTDSDFDDIRILMKCPSGGWLGDLKVGLVE